MKNTLLLIAGIGLLTVVVGCNQSNNADQTAADTNSTMQSAQDTASNAWQDTKSGASNAANAVASGATNAWNKTTNAVGH